MEKNQIKSKSKMSKAEKAKPQEGKGEGIRWRFGESQKEQKCRAVELSRDLRRLQRVSTCKCLDPYSARETSHHETA